MLVPRFLATISSIEADNWWNLIAAISGGIIGALAGGIPAYLIAAAAARQNAAKDREAQVQSELAHLHSTFIKLLEIVNGYFTICSQINEMLYNAHVNGHKEWELWRKVLPLLGVDGAGVYFTSAEMALFMRSSADSDYANALLLLDKRYRSFLRTINAYAERREKLMGMLDADHLVDGVGTTHLTREQLGKVLPLAHALNSVAGHIVDTMHEDRRTAAKLADEFGGRAKRLFPNHRVPSFVSADSDSGEHIHESSDI